MRTIYGNEARVNIFTGKGNGTKEITNEVMRIVPGRNSIDDDIFDKVTHKNQDFENAVASGAVIVQGDSSNIAGMSAKSALAIIEMETTVDGLEDLLKQETATGKARKGVTQAISDRIRTIRDAEKAKKDGGVD